MDPVGKQLLEIAKDNLGYTEKGDGYTKFGNWWTEKVDDDHNPYFKTAPWCDMFLAWAADQAGVADQAGLFASTVLHAKWFRKHDAWGTKPVPGALVFYDWNGSSDLDQIDHVGLVEKVDGKTLHTIEANADGYKLMRKKRDMDTVVGFGYPSKVKTEKQAYVPKHAAPAKPEALTPAAIGSVPKTQTTTAQLPEDLPSQELLLSSALAIVLCGTVALAAGRAAAAKAPTASPIRVRKRGKHHRTTPVELPADLTPTDLDRADATTTVMPALSQATAHAAEDQEFWGRIAHLEEDEELAFWDSLHAESTEPLIQEYASGPTFR